MGDDEIRFEDLLDDEPVAAAPPTSYRQFLAEGLSPHGGLPQLEALAGLDDTDPRFSSVRSTLEHLLQVQARRA